ncbi:hypothetical protein [Micromonospora globbae]|uniref:hypothetical protein n=1 Tax=Micromonospora globbae TaxID=1894969 RepID=UPI00341E54C8
MGVRAVIVVRDDTGHTRRFWAAWASKQFQIPHLARFIHTTDEGAVPLSVAGYLAYTATHPGTLPAQDITDERWYADPDDVGDLDHRYELALRATERTFRYLVHDRDHGGDRPGWRRGEELATRAQLHEAAARMCRELAANTQRYAERNNGAVPPGWPTAQDWREQEDIFTEWSARTDPHLLHRPGPSIEPVPQWFAVRAARAQSRRISAALRETHPGANVRTRVGAGGVISLTVPVHLATDGEAARITELVGGLLGHAFTVTVRPHRRPRHGVHGGQTVQPAVNATLTLRPRPNAAGPQARDATTTDRTSG